MYLLVVKDERRVIKKKGTLRIVPNPITDANTGVEHKTLGGKVRDAGLPKSMAELGTAWLFTKGCHPPRKVQFFLTLFKRPLTPPPFI